METQEHNFLKNDEQLIISCTLIKQNKPKILPKSPKEQIESIKRSIQLEVEN
jgi:hypothetical protein